MGTFTLVLIVVLVFLAIALLFPFVFWVEFHANKTGAEVKLFLFKRLLWTYEKVWKEDSAEDLPVDEEIKAADEKAETAEKEVEKPVVAESPKPAVEPKAKPVSKPKEKPVQEEPRAASLNEQKNEPEAAPQVEPKGESKEESKVAPESTPRDVPEETPEEEKKSLTEREFWTLLLTPDFDERGLGYAKKILGCFMKVFCVRFVDCYVEGIRMDYESMGYGAAVNAMMKGYPFLKDWDVRMDWTHDHDLQAAGKICADLNLCRTFAFLFASSVRIGVMALIFWRRRVAVLKTGQLPELGYVRKKILDWLVEE